MSAPHDPQTFPPGVLGDRYELGPVIGRGGMADVHRAHDRLLSRDVAVKVLRDVAPDADDRARFVTEARTLAGLAHPGLVVVLDAGFSHARPYLVMELVEGRTLAQAIDAGPLDPARVRLVGERLAESLEYAHHRGVVHRDVKPGNVLLTATDRVKLADFGVARLLGDVHHHTRTGQTVGTPAYLAPEQVRGEEVTPAVDIYSLGLVLLEALTGDRAFPGPATEAAVARLHARPAVPQHLEPELGRILAAMTETDPTARPTAAEVRAALRRTASGPVPGGAAPVDPTLLLAPADPVGSGPLDRAGEAVVGWSRRVEESARHAWSLARAQPSNLWAVAGAVAVLLLFLLLVAVLA